MVVKHDGTPRGVQPQEAPRRPAQGVREAAGPHAQARGDRRRGREHAPRPRGPRDLHAGDRRLRHGTAARARPGRLRALRLRLPPLRGHRRVHGRAHIPDPAHASQHPKKWRPDPWADGYASLFFLSRFQAEVDRLFQEAVKLSEGSLPAGGEWQPSIDVVEDTTSVMILAELPGLAASDLQVTVRGTLVTLSGTKSTPRPGAQRIKFHCMERGHGRFFREIHLFSPVNTHQGTRAPRRRPPDDRVSEDPGQAPRGSRIAYPGDRRTQRGIRGMNKPPTDRRKRRSRSPTSCRSCRSRTRWSSRTSSCPCPWAGTRASWPWTAPWPRAGSSCSWPSATAPSTTPAKGTCTTWARPRSSCGCSSCPTAASASWSRGSRAPASITSARWTRTCRRRSSASRSPGRPPGWRPRRSCAASRRASTAPSRSARASRPR